VGVLEGPLAVDLEDAALGETAQQRLADFRRIDACLACERERLGDDSERAADDHLVTELAELTRTRLADMNHLLGVPHDVENRLRTSEGGGVAANHDRQGAVDRADI